MNVDLHCRWTEVDRAICAGFARRGVLRVDMLARQIGLWSTLESAVSEKLGDRDGRRLLAILGDLLIRSSSAAARLGSFRMDRGESGCIRLQFAQGAHELIETFRHELAHACDFLSGDLQRSGGSSHGASWKNWARRLGATTLACGESESLRALYRRKRRVVGVCRRCGFELQRVRGLDRGREYLHVGCGGCFARK